MGVVRNIFAGRGPAGLALDFGAETITLLAEDVQAAQGWSPLGAAELAADDFPDQIEALRAVAAEHTEDCAVDLWLPQDQILNTHLELNGARPWSRIAKAKAALAERTALGADEINVDLTRAPGDVWAICAVEAKVVAEAQDYARRWGFAPNMVTTRYADAAFTAPPDLTGDEDRRPLILGGAAAAAAAACVAVGVLAWPTSDPKPLASGPERIAMAPAIAPQAPATAENAVVTPSVRADDVVAVRQPAAPEPGSQLPVAKIDPDSDFAASILSPSQQFPDLLSVDFSLPQAEAATPIYANVAYRAPLISRSALDGAATEAAPEAEEPTLRQSAPPLQSLDEGFDDAAPAPSDLGAFDVAALGPAPLALRTEDLLVESEAVTAPEVGEAPSVAAEETSDPDEDPAAEDTAAAPDDGEDAVAAEDDAETDTPPQGGGTIVQNAGDPRERGPEADAADQQAEEDDTPGPGAVAAAPSPGKRPSSLDMSPGPGAVAAAPSARTRPDSIKPKPKAVARNTSSAKTVRAPDRGKPTGKTLAKIVTLRDAIALDKTSLLGVFGAKNNRRALLRLADGRMKRVSQGEVVDGWVISRIEATSMRMTRGGEVRNLKLIR